MKKERPHRYGLSYFGVPLNIQRAVSGEQIFRQSKQKSARIVDPIRRIFVTNDGKDAADSPCDEFLEVPISKNIFRKDMKT